ncbi:Trp biosynthesis-associated membrane protein [Subtercola boreus]|uniref:Trp biosynthesis protein n=1 Tax=Subtercola boreus TaxID=120213 RepID=A0A3E0WD37_9MICO|nr:Trp biosynthesis-associated membrane protein [Subtercola boreus]RFA21287.1 hypothetical protein B7R24_07865 [Subtercola boreus]RFA21670.1 hypothetical protein B7R23_07810 [Subtercola boreus]RFA27640.1 hypothetical protein B7R25_07935 [Subtercola boreus]
MTGGTGSAEQPSPADATATQGGAELRASRTRRLKSLTILAVIVWSALVFLSWSQPWFTLHAQGRAGDTVSVTVQGAVAAPALSALALAGLALSAALAIAGRFIRIVLGVLELVLGVSITFSAVAALADPVGAGQSAITTATGVAGTSSISQIATAAGAELWPFLAIVAGVLMALTGILIVLSIARWPESGRKYQPVTYAAADGRTSGDPADLVLSDEERVPNGALSTDAEALDATTPDDTTDADDTTPRDRGVHRDVDTARTQAVDSWDSLTRGQDPTD